MKLYNTLTRSIDELTTLEPGKLKMYTCGLTVYSQPQIGNWVAYIYSDILVRTLKYSGLSVFRVQNITDVGHLVSDADSGEDKMEKGARAEGKTAWEVADKYIKIAEIEGYDWLKLLRPDKVVRATDLIDQQINFVKILEQKGFTYIIPSEGVYFDTSKFPNYGELAQLDIAGLKAGARVEVYGKKYITDFALWKFSPANQRRDMEWESPWGIGFPGWHLECSVIAYDSLGEQIDLHSGGIDHIPVHHTNEIAQTESVTGKQFSRFWFHNNHIKINGAKLSKSLNNSYTLTDINNKGYSLDAFKLMVISSHYRTEGNFSFEILSASQNRLNAWYSVSSLTWQTNDDTPSKELEDLVQKASASLLESLQNDLDTPTCLMIIDELFSSIQPRSLSVSTANKLAVFLDQINTLLGIDLFVPDISSDQKALIVERSTARSQKNWQKSDKLRDLLSAQGITINDTDSDSTWSWTKSD